MKRREFLKLAPVLSVAAACATRMPADPAPPVVVNDVHSALNPTPVERVHRAADQESLRRLVRDAASRRAPLAVSGSRHAMGGQQFARGSALLDTRAMNRIISFDRDRGLLEVEAGIEWPELMDWLLAAQGGADAPGWGIRQKQTGADRFTIGGSLSANIHGRGLTMRPFIDDLENLTLLTPRGETLRCSRAGNRQLFSLVCGGYGLFGIVTAATLRLAPRVKVEREVEIESIDRLASRFAERIDGGYLYGDFQFGIDPAADTFLRRGVFSCYRTVDPDTPIPSTQGELSPQQWAQLLTLAHANKSEAYRLYTEYYLATSGQIYWSDTHQRSTYLPDYHRMVDAATGAAAGTEMITEIYVPRHRLADFMAAAAADFRRHGVDVVYGTVRLIERDDESFLAWAREPWACIIFNLHVNHARPAPAREAFVRLIDLALERGGSYYLTYHRWARRDQVEAAHPRLAEFLRLKEEYDPRGVMQSDWWRHYAAMFGRTAIRRHLTIPRRSFLTAAHRQAL
jgi:FAD/FMN-containing dehydrogenase